MSFTSAGNFVLGVEPLDKSVRRLVSIPFLSLPLA